MEATKATINTIINSQALVEIPFFQRSYVWKEELWSRLLDDVSYVATNHNTFHFLGSVILKEMPVDRVTSNGEHKKVKILVDGQQRVTTLIILLKVIALKFNRGDLFDDKFYGIDNKPLLAHGRNDRDAFEEVLGMTEAVKIDNSEKKSKVIEAYNYFIDNIDHRDIKIDNGRQFTYLIDHLLFVSIVLGGDDNEQQIFDTLNSLGVNLTTSELLKNFFFSKETEQLYQSHWVDVFESDKETKDYWDIVLDQGRCKKAMIDIFVESLFKILVQNFGQKIGSDDKERFERSENLSLSIQKFVSQYCNDDKHIFINSMKDYAETFRKCFNPAQCKIGFCGESALERLNVVMFGLKHTTMIPYILFVAKNCPSEEEKERIYHVIESYYMRRIIARLSSKQYNTLLYSIIQNRVLDADALLTRFQNQNEAVMPSDETIRQELHNPIRTKPACGILYLLECHMRDTRSATQLLGFNSYSLEHMMPKNWRKKWPKCTADSDPENRNTMLQTIGNLAIIPQELNASIRDSDWNTKKEGSGKRPGLKTCAAGLLTLADPLTKDVWNEEEILKRTEWICDQVLKYWSI